MSNISFKKNEFILNKSNLHQNIYIKSLEVLKHEYLWV